jgi:hypothetical protein
VQCCAAYFRARLGTEIAGVRRAEVLRRVPPLRREREDKRLSKVSMTRYARICARPTTCSKD